jgi:aspartate carbamoyltransferase regulatory subunit
VKREYKVFQIDHGTVIDHLPHWSALKVVELLGLSYGQNLVTIGIGLESRKLGRKDLLKVENRELTESEVQKLALVAPQASINLIRNGLRVEKLKVSVPESIDGLVRCANTACITRHEYVPPRYTTVGRLPLELCCYYCNHTMQADEIELL